MNSEASSSSVVCAKDAVEVVREAIAKLEIGATERKEKVALLSGELKTLRERLERLHRKHPWVKGVALSDEVVLLLEQVRREGR